jgi:hypothetical protein
LFTLERGELADIQDYSRLVTYAQYIDYYQSDMKEDILSVSELPTHTTNSEIYTFLNGFIEEGPPL